MTAHTAKWTAPAPLWPDILIGGPVAQRSQFDSPAILRFAEDDFMERFLAVLERSPGHIADFLAVHETWESPAPSPGAHAVIEPAHEKSKFALKLNRLEKSRNRLITPRTLPESPATNKPLKLFQPAHQRFYLVTASLVCGFNGLTDHKIDTSHQEQAGFVIRRLLPADFISGEQEYDNSDPSGWDEYAFVSAAGEGGWQKVDPEPARGFRRIVPGEELLPLFPVHYREDDGRKKRVLAGTIPTARRDAYLAAPRVHASDSGSGSQSPRPKTARAVLFRTKVAEPWKSLIEQAKGVANLQDPSNQEKLTDDEIKKKNAEIRDLVKKTREQIQVVSWYILLDFARYLEKYLPALWSVIHDQKGVEELKTKDERNLLNVLNSTTWREDLLEKTRYSQSHVADSLSEALRRIAANNWEWDNKLDQVLVPYDREKETPDTNPQWPPFLFPLADPNHRLAVNLSSIGAVDDLIDDDDVDGDAFMNTEGEPSTPGTAAAAAESVDKLVALVVRALPRDDVKQTPPIPLAASKVMDLREGWFLIRCVYVRPNCGPLHPPELSLPTVPFQMAGFFDPDAPARPIRIGLPIDTSPAGLRKFDKNTAFMISNVLCGQMKRAKGLSLGDLVLSVLPWPFHKDLPGSDTGPCVGKSPFGMMCTLSIPIITIAAMILLTIIVSVLNIIFRWIPFFTICFPIPGFRAKKETSTEAPKEKA